MCVCHGDMATEEEWGRMSPWAPHLMPVSDQPVNQPITQIPIRGPTLSTASWCGVKLERFLIKKGGKKTWEGEKALTSHDMTCACLAFLRYCSSAVFCPASSFLYFICMNYLTLFLVLSCSVHFEECVLESVKPENSNTPPPVQESTSTQAGVWCKKQRFK